MRDIIKRGTNMKRFTLIVILVTLLTSPGCNQSSQQANVSSSVISQPLTASHLAAVSLDVQATGIHKQTIVRNDGTVLRFTISIPDTYSDQTPSPLIVALHYGGKVTPFYGRGIIDNLVGLALAELDSIIIAPDSMGGDWRNETNEVAVIQIMESVIQSYNVDKTKTLLTGFSMGGIGTWYLAGRNQDRFSAAIPIAGIPSTDTDWKIPLYIIHSRQDEVIPIKPTLQYVAELKTKGADVELVIIDGVTHYETEGFAEPLRGAIPWIKKIWN
ncbi:MAG: hypothetical protein COA86_17590 [Kangiella sp.]|nr:MAG: hypothetical protein COA86_17590 [Kangiella sp.]